MLVKWLVLFVILIQLFSCKKDLVGPQYSDSPIKTPGASGIWILNEGGFGWGNASISFYDTQRKQISNRVFENKQDTPLGDVLQSMFTWNEKRFLVLNYSNNIKICDTEMNLLETISGLNSPRYMTNLNDTEFLITSLEAEQILKYNSETKSTSLFSEVDEWTEKIYKMNDYIIVEQKSKLNANPTNQNILKLDKEGNLLKTIEIKEDHSDLTPINESKFCFLSGTTTQSKLWISDSSFQPKLFNVPEKINQISYSNEHIYLVGQNLWEFNLKTENFVKLISLTGRNIYGLNSSNDGFVYLADAKDYVSSGDFLIYSVENNSFIDSVKTSYIPSEIYFEQ